MLTILGTGGLTVGLSACGVRTSGGAPSGAVAPSKHIHIPKTGAKLPRGDVNFQWMDNGEGLRVLFEKPFFNAYQRAHPNIHVNYDATTWDRIDQVIPLAVRNGNPPDVFAMPDNVPSQVAVQAGWVAPIDDVVPGFAAWKAKFPPNAFLPGVHEFNGKTYSWPYSSGKRYGRLLLYDTEYLKSAGYHPAERPLTWDEFRAAAKKVTQRGKGQYYGLVGPGAALGGIALSLANVAGMRGGGDGFDWKTGRYNYDGPPMVAAVELLLAIQSDGSFFPGSMSLTQTAARARMPAQRIAGMIFDGPWDVGQWPLANPNYRFGVAMPPIPNNRKWHPTAYQETGADLVWLSAQSKQRAIVGDIFAYIGSLEGQAEMVTLSGGGLVSEMPAANVAANRSKLLTSKAKTANQLSNELLRLAPMVQLRNPATAAVLIEMKAVKPSLADVVQGLFTGQLKNVQAALTDLARRSDQNLDAAIAAARAKGANVTRDDWVFPNWNPANDYGAADYKGLH